MTRRGKAQGDTDTQTHREPAAEAVHLSGERKGRWWRGEEAHSIDTDNIYHHITLHLTMACITFETTFISARKARHSGTEGTER